MIVEPFANDTVQDNLNPVGRVMYGASSQICVPVSLARKGPALGAQAGEARLREVVVAGGDFTNSVARPRRHSTWCWKRGRSRLRGRSGVMRRCCISRACRRTS